MSTVRVFIVHIRFPMHKICRLVAGSPGTYREPQAGVGDKHWSKGSCAWGRARLARKIKQTAHIDVSTLPETNDSRPPRQVLDTGLDESSCYFEDGDGLEVEHGHFFERLGLVLGVYTSATISDSASAVWEFEGGDFTFDLERRKVCVSVPIIYVPSCRPFIVVRIEIFVPGETGKNAAQPLPPC